MHASQQLQAVVGESHECEWRRKEAFARRFATEISAGAMGVAEAVVARMDPGAAGIIGAQVAMRQPQSKTQRDSRTRRKRKRRL